MLSSKRSILFVLFTLMVVSNLLVQTSCSSDDSDDASDSDSDTDTDGDTDDADCDWSNDFADFFPDDQIVEFDIVFDDPGAWEEMIDHQDEEWYMSATVTINGESMTQVGVRFKGNSSLQMSGDTNTKSLKVHFEEYITDQRFNCVDRVSLNNATKDPSMMREVLAYRLAEDFGIPAPRTAFAELTVDGELHGLFTMVQQVDHRFLKDVYGTTDYADDGNLYKLYSDYDFSYLGADATPDDYGNSEAETGLVLKTNEDDSEMNTFEDVTLWTKALDDVLQDPSAANQAALEEVMNVDGYLRFQAWTLAISNLDAYYSQHHNLYVYSNPVTGKFETLPWDANEAYGSFPCMSGGPGEPPVDGDEDVYTVALQRPCGAEEVLNKLSYMVPEYEARYCEFLQEFVDVGNTSSGGFYSIDGEDSRIEALHDLVGEARQRMDDEGVMTQPPGDYTYQEYLTNQSHEVSTDEDGGPGAPAPGPNLGYFNEERLANLVTQINGICGN